MTACIVVASGPSFTEGQAELIIAARAADKCRVIVVNNNWEYVPNADVLYAAGANWWAEYGARALAEFGGECWTCVPATAQKYGLCCMPYENGPGLSPKRGVIRSGYNSGYQAIGLAHELDPEADPILTVGFDMQFTGGRRHHHADHPEPMGNANGVKEWVKNFPQLAADLRARGVRLINCSIETALTIERADLAETLAAL